MKINKMPITVVLLTISWCLLVLSILVPVYLVIVSGGINPDLLIIILAVFLVGIISAALIRMFANIGQIIFDIKQEMQRVREINKGVNQNILGLGQSFGNELQNQTMEIDKIIKGLNISLKAELQTQNSERDRITKGINQSLADGISGINKSIKNELINQTTELDKIIKALDRSLTESQALKSQAVKSELQNQTSELNKSILKLSGELVSELKSLSANLQILANSSEQINCDSKDLNQNISQIKTFFEQIERHLDLKQ
ncbi:MAG: hypothetical protein PHY35_02525 [Candidatus Omnitrophica bacterium]|nr:hypothetical protein [Candidatus Omnitrophota bacterium]